MSNMSITDIQENVEKICRSHKVEHLYLFGSYATGDATATSDIDIVIKGGERIPELKAQIDNIKTLKKIDVFEYDKCQNKHLKEAMDKYGKQMY